MKSIKLFEYKPVSGREKVKGKSLTIVGQSYTINELINKFQGGQVLNVGKNMVYGEDKTLVSTILDPTELDEIVIEQVEKKRVAEKEKLEKLRAETEAKKKKELEDAVALEIARREKERNEVK